MRSWQERPIEYANLLNPAFCSILLQKAIRGYQKQKQQDMPYPLIFLVLPIILHSSTRQVLPRDTRTKLHIWLQRQPEVRAGFSDRAKNLVPYAKEALIFGMQTGIIDISASGQFTWVKGKLKSILPVSWSDDIMWGISP